MNQELLIKTEEGGEKELLVGKVLKDLTIYNRIQVELAKRFLAKGKLKESSDNWVFFYSPEFREAMEEIVREEDDFMKAYQEVRDKVMKEIEDRIDLLHRLEIRVMEHFKTQNVGLEDFITWHEKYARKFLKIIHANPDILKEFKSSEDKEPGEQEKILAEIEDRLYH
jgi:hypothetical protein